MVISGTGSNTPHLWLCSGLSSVPLPQIQIRIVLSWSTCVRDTDKYMRTPTVSELTLSNVLSSPLVYRICDVFEASVILPHLLFLSLHGILFVVGLFAVVDQRKVRVP